MIVQLLTEHHLEFLSLIGGCRTSSESTLVKLPHCWKSHAAAHIVIFQHQNGPIHYAVTHCTLPPVRTLVSLISAGADVNLVDAVRLFIYDVMRKLVFGGF